MTRYRAPLYQFPSPMPMPSSGHVAPEHVAIALSSADIREAQQYGLAPLVYALIHATGTLWRISECGTAIEVMAPFRTFVLEGQALQLWQRYRQTGFVPPHRCEVICQSLVAPTSEFPSAA